MKRYAISVLCSVAVVGALASIAASPNESAPKASALDGKAVIIQMRGVHFGVKENVRIETVGDYAYIVVPFQYGDGVKTYEHWWPMDKVAGLEVFDSLEDAQAHHKETSSLKNPNTIGD